MFLDTSGLLAYLFQNEPYHEIAVSFLESNERKTTHNYILAELVALAEARKYPRTAVLGFVADVMFHPQIEMAWIDVELHNEAVALLVNRPDKSYSLCDAASFVIMKRRGIVSALTTDRHFEQEGFLRLL